MDLSLSLSSLFGNRSVRKYISDQNPSLALDPSRTGTSVSKYLSFRYSAGDFSRNSPSRVGTNGHRLADQSRVFHSLARISEELTPLRHSIVVSVVSLSHDNSFASA